MPFGTAANAQALAKGKTGYDKFGYYGMFAMIDRSVIYAYWQELFDGKSVASSASPGDTPLEVAVDQDADGNYKTTALKDNLVLNGPGMDNLGTVGSTGTFICHIKTADPNVRLTLYAGDKRVGAVVSDWSKTVKTTLKRAAITSASLRSAGYRATNSAT